MSKSSTPRSALVAPLIASGLVLLLGGTAISHLSPTIDEWRYLHDGSRYWFTGDAEWLIHNGAHPFPFWIQNIPGATWLAYNHAGLFADGDFVNYARHLSPGEQRGLLFSARWVNLILSGLGTVWAVWWVGQRWMGVKAAAVAALIAAIEPNLLASYVLATADALIVPLGLLCLYFFHAHLVGGRFVNLVLAAIAFGLGVAWKVSLFPQGILLLMAAAACATILTIRNGSPVASSRPILRVVGTCSLAAGKLLAVVVVGLAVSWPLNGFKVGTLLNPETENGFVARFAMRAGMADREAWQLVAQLKQLSVPAPLTVIQRQAAHSKGGHPATFLGRHFRQGPWFYYPYIFAMKTHALVLILGLVGIFSRRAWNAPIAWAMLLLLALSLTMAISQGPRYFLLLYGLMALSAAAAVEGLVKVCAVRARLPAVATLGAAALLLTLSSWPDFLTHTNLLWGGDVRGNAYADANYDWGQGLYQAIHQGRTDQQATTYVHVGDPHFGVPRDVEVLTGREPDFIERIQGRRVAISVGLIDFYPSSDPDGVRSKLDSLPTKKPPTRLTNTYYLFDLRDSGRAATVASSAAK